MRAGEFYKQDRVMRLMRILALFQARPHGLTTGEMAGRLKISQRTVQRDLLHLKSELHVPFVLVGTQWNVPSDFFLLPLMFNVHQAMAMLLRARLMLRLADKANTFAAAAYEEVAAALPAPAKDPVMEAADLLASRRQDPIYLAVLTGLIAAWAERRKVVITYTTENTFQSVVLPLFIEPSATGRSCYLIAWDHKLAAPRKYKVERISAVELMEERFDPPLGFSIGRHLAHARGAFHVHVVEFGGCHSSSRPWVMARSARTGDSPAAWRKQPQ